MKIKIRRLNRPNFLAQKREKAYRKIGEINPEIPEEIGQIIEKFLQPEKEKRFKSVDEFLSKIESF